MRRGSALHFATLLAAVATPMVGASVTVDDVLAFPKRPLGGPTLPRLRPPNRDKAARRMERKNSSRAARRKMRQKRRDELRRFKP